MPNCFNCNHEFNYGDSFCSNCGRKFKTPKQDFPKKPHLVYPHNDLSRELRALDNKRLKYAKISAGCIAPLTLLITLASIKSGNWTLTIIFLILNLGVPLFFIYRNRTHDEYYELPGAWIDGKHRCVFCGHKGIYKKGEYKSNCVTASCTGCEAFLYCESKS